MDPAPLRPTLAALACAAALAGCGGPHHTACPPDDGVVLLAWTIGGRASTAANACDDIDHLVLDLDTACGPVEIEPIPCTAGQRWRYDGLPAGNATASLYAVDARGSIVASGFGLVTLADSVPDTPTAIDLR